MRLIPCQSSNLTGIGYQPGSAKFYICFNGGSTYEYTCPKMHGLDPVAEARAYVTSVLFASSQGSAFNSLVKGNSLVVHRKLTDQEIADLEFEV